MRYHVIQIYRDHKGWFHFDPDQEEESEKVPSSNLTEYLEEGYDFVLKEKRFQRKGDPREGERPWGEVSVYVLRRLDKK